MSPKNLNASNKTHKFLLNQLKDKQTSKIYKKFEKNLDLKEDFIVAVSGGPDSLALCFLSKIYSIKKHIKVKYFHVDHKLRNNSTKEAKFVKLIIKKLSTNLEILTWVGKKPKSNIQSIARDKRYELLLNKAKKLKINNILLGHHKDDLIENFFIRILRGSGLNGMVSFDQKTNLQNINLIRPLLKFSKQNLEYITKKVFKKNVEDPSNKNDKFKRVKIRNFIKYLELEGLDNDKFNLTIKNSSSSNSYHSTCSKSYVWNGTSYSSSIIDSVTLTSANGCDSIAYLYLTILDETYSTQNLTSCDSVLFNGTVYNQSGIYTDTL